MSQKLKVYILLYMIFFEAEANRQKFIRHQNLDGPLIKVKCQIRLIDYQEMSKKLTFSLA